MTAETTSTSAPSMTRMQRLRRWILRLALFLVFFVPIYFIMAGWGSRLGLWDWRFGFGKMTYAWGPKLLIFTAGLGAISTILSLAIKPMRGIAISLLAMLIPISGLLYAKSVRTKAQSLPFIHDVTTDTQNPPSFTDAILSERNKVPNVNTVDYLGKTAGKDNKLVSALQTQAYPDVSTLVLSDAPDVAFGEAKTAVKALGWELVSEDVQAGRIEATDTTFWFGFKDDIAIRIVPSEGGGSVVDIRSISRVGGSDLGANAARIREFLELMRAG